MMEGGKSESNRTLTAIVSSSSMLLVGSEKKIKKKYFHDSQIIVALLYIYWLTSLALVNHSEAVDDGRITETLLRSASRHHGSGEGGRSVCVREGGGEGGREGCG